MPLPSPETLGHLPTVIFLLSHPQPTLLRTHHPSCLFQTFLSSPLLHIRGVISHLAEVPRFGFRFREGPPYFRRPPPGVGWREGARVREARVRSQAGSFNLALVGQKGWRQGEAHPVVPAVSPFYTASHPFPRRPGQGGDPEGRAQRKHLAWLGRAGKRRVGSSAGGRGRKRGSGRASCPSLPSHPHPSALLGSGKAVTAKLTAAPAAPAVSSCAVRARGTLAPQPRPRPRPLRACSGEQARRRC